MTPVFDPSHASSQSGQPYQKRDSNLILPKKQFLTTHEGTRSESEFRSRSQETKNRGLDSGFSPRRTFPDAPARFMPDHDLLSSVYERSASGSTRSLSLSPSDELFDDPRQVILRSFAPRVVCYASTDTEDFVKLKGFRDGLLGALSSFAERIHGKVVIRDSMGASRSWEDFGIRFIDPKSMQHGKRPQDGTPINGSTQDLDLQRPLYGDNLAVSIDEIVQHHLDVESEVSEGTMWSVQGSSLSPRPSPEIQQLGYLSYLRKLLSSMPIVPQETFAHPVACIIAVSSHNSAPIECFRQLYENTVHAVNEIPSWISTEYLRYYVLIHDEDRNDIVKSIALFDLMKRHFGLHCHLLRLRSTQCVQTDDDSVKILPCEWLSAEQALAQIRRRDHLNDVETDETYIHESDVTAIRGFLREFVTQSVIPFMEGRVATWNNQVASRRRGISGRFMSLSKRFAGLGSNKPTISGTAESSGSSSNSNFDPLRGYYMSESTEAIMRQLADYAFMLRDWKLAHQIYETLRVDFANDKAWVYHAAANEMAAISYLLLPQTINTKVRTETIDQMLDTGVYSYLVRCSIPFGAIRCVTVVMELLKSHGSTTAKDAAKCGAKLLDLGILQSNMQALTTERIAECYRSGCRAGLLEMGSRKRQAAFWDLLASMTWIDRGRSLQAQRRLQLACISYQDFGQETLTLPFPSMQNFWDLLTEAANIENEPLSTGAGLNVSEKDAELTPHLETELANGE